MTRAALAVPMLVAAFAPSGRAADRAPGGEDRCVVHAAAEDRVVQGRNLAVADPSGVRDAVAIRGDVTVRRGAVVRKAVAIGGSVAVEEGAAVTEDAIAVGGDVRVARGGRVGKDALALDGQVRAAEGAVIAGKTFSLAFSAGGESLGQKILAELGAEGCRVVPEAGR
ncbi:MAG TPA: hypothetical protein VLU43_00120 [Anaeromyxobacteraceae bacterium]|nr:hypothetical protein [Anaeromyxobacteraceae bacterium]